MAGPYVLRRILVGALVVAVGVVVVVSVEDARTSSHAGASSTSRTSAALTSSLNARVQKVASANSGVDVAISVLEPSTGRAYAFGPTSGLIAASISKLDILEALLLSHEAAHTPLSDGQDASAAAMIEQSDNGEGQSLWNELGSAAGMSAANSTLGLAHTSPDPEGYYGLTTTGPGDQVTLLRHLIGAPGPLDAASQAYALGLLDNVDSDQAWGVTAAADAGTTSAVKNGWLAIDSDSDRWAVNSDGIVTVDGHQLVMSIMSQHDASEQSGISLVESLAKIVGPGLAG